MRSIDDQTRLLRRGLTLVEVLLVVALVGVLISLALPSLAGSRDRARAAAALASLRGHMQVFASYAGSNGDAWPAFTDPLAPQTIIESECLSGSGAIPYFGASWAWNVALARDYYDGDCRSASFVSPFAADKRGSYIPSFTYSCAMIADPGFWNPANRTGPQQLRGTRHDETTWPASKVVLTDSDRLLALPRSAGVLDISRKPTGYAFADGSAADLTTRELRAGYSSGEIIVPGAMWPLGIHNTDYPPGAHTIDGVRGRDR